MCWHLSHSEGGVLYLAQLSAYVIKYMLSKPYLFKDSSMVSGYVEGHGTNEYTLYKPTSISDGSLARHDWAFKPCNIKQLIHLLQSGNKMTCAPYLAHGTLLALHALRCYRRQANCLCRREALTTPCQKDITKHQRVMAAIGTKGLPRGEWRQRMGKRQVSGTEHVRKNCGLPNALMRNTLSNG